MTLYIGDPPIASHQYRCIAYHYWPHHIGVSLSTPSHRRYCWLASLHITIATALISRICLSFYRHYRYQPIALVYHNALMPVVKSFPLAILRCDLCRWSMISNPTDDNHFRWPTCTEITYSKRVVFSLLLHATCRLVYGFEWNPSNTIYHLMPVQNTIYYPPSRTQKV